MSFLQSLLPDLLKPKTTYIDNYITKIEIYKNDKWNIYLQCHGSQNFYNFYSVYVKVKETGNTKNITTPEALHDVWVPFGDEETIKIFTDHIIYELPELTEEKENIIKAITENNIIGTIASYDGAAKMEPYYRY